MGVDFDSVKAESLGKLIEICKLFLDFIVGDVATVRQNLNALFREFSFLKEMPVSFRQISGEPEPDLFDELAFFNVVHETVPHFDFNGRLLSFSLDFAELADVSDPFDLSPLGVDEVGLGFDLLEFSLGLFEDLLDAFFEKF